MWLVIILDNEQYKKIIVIGVKVLGVIYSGFMLLRNFEMKTN